MAEPLRALCMALPGAPALGHPVHPVLGLSRASSGSAEHPPCFGGGKEIASPTHRENCTSLHHLLAGLSSVWAAGRGVTPCPPQLQALHSCRCTLQSGVCHEPQECQTLAARLARGCPVL